MEFNLFLAIRGHHAGYTHNNKKWLRRHSIWFDKHVHEHNEYEWLHLFCVNFRQFCE